MHTPSSTESHFHHRSAILPSAFRALVTPILCVRIAPHVSIERLLEVSDDFRRLNVVAHDAYVLAFPAAACPGQIRAHAHALTH